jgi:hypothetical protein
MFSSLVPTFFSSQIIFRSHCTDRGMNRNHIPMWFFRVGICGFSNLENMLLMSEARCVSRNVSHLWRTTLALCQGEPDGWRCNREADPETGEVLRSARQSGERSEMTRSPAEHESPTTCIAADAFGAIHDDSMIQT